MSEATQNDREPTFAPHDEDTTGNTPPSEETSAADVMLGAATMARSHVDLSENAESGEAKLGPRKPIELRVDKDKIVNSELIPDTMKGWMSRLPETLRFDEPITLIVGENTTGKTQFAEGVITSLGRHREGTDARNRPRRPTKDSPAIDVAEAFAPTELRHGNSVTHVIEGARIMAHTRQGAHDQAALHNSGHIGDEFYKPGSTRELFDMAIGEQARRIREAKKHASRDFPDRDDLKANDAEAIVVFDEPEHGLSPLRQMNLPKELIAMFDPEDTLLVPTNNLALFLSDLPRLDINHPERGVHRPSDYGETARIEFHGTPTDK